jgi:hypothetical protein
MEPVYGTHLGLVVSSTADPEGRNRVQVWIPYLSSTLYKSVNSKVQNFEALKDLKFKGPEDLNGIDPLILETLQNILPWAEYAAPLFGGSSGLFNTATGKTATTSQSTIQAETNQTPSLPNTTTNMSLSGNKPADIKVNSTLAQDRQSYFQGQITQEMLDRLAFVANREVGSNAGSQQAFFETVFNRAQFSGTSLSSVINNSAYGFTPGSANASSVTQSAVANVLNGSNITNLATDNASNAPGNPVANRRIAAGVSGSWFKNGQAVPAGTAGAEFLYRADGSGGYSSTAGLNAGKYAQANNLETTRDPTLIAQGSAPLHLKYTDISAKYGVPSNVGVNGSAVGTFSTPNAGSKVWVFFVGGDIQRPVYFAQAPSAGDIAALNSKKA